MSLRVREEFERHCQARAKRQPDDFPYGSALAVATVLGDSKCVVNQRDRSIAQHLLKDGFWESWVSIAIDRAVKPGAYCVDVGANVGYYTLLMARRAARVLAIEANPEFVALLKQTAALNLLDDAVRTLHAAAWSESGDTVELSVPTDLHGGATVLKPSFDVGLRFHVETTTVDDAVKVWPRVDVVKIDVEGVEDRVLDGMQMTIERNPELQVFVEFTPVAHEDPAALLEQWSERFHVERVAFDGSIEQASLHTLATGSDWTMLHLKRRD